MRTTISGLGVEYIIEGPSGAPVVTLSHSLAADLRMWEPQVRALTGTYQVLRYDTRGHGGTDVPAGPYTWDMLAEDVVGLLAALGIDETHFVGLSMGGMIGQVLALTHPKVVKSLALCDTSAFMSPGLASTWDDRIRTALTDGMGPLAEPTLSRWFTPAFARTDPGVVSAVRSQILSTDPRGYAACASIIKTLDLLDRLPAIRVPTLIVVGEDDQSTPVTASEAIRVRIEGSELHVLQSAAHLSTIEQAADFNRLLLTFLKRIDPQR